MIHVLQFVRVIALMIVVLLLAVVRVAPAMADNLEDPIRTTVEDHQAAIGREFSTSREANATCTLSTYGAEVAPTESLRPTRWSAHAHATAECASLDRRLPTFGMHIEITYQRWINGDWEDLSEPPGECYRPFTVAGHETCLHSTTGLAPFTPSTALDDLSWYRTRFVVSVDGATKVERYALLNPVTPEVLCTVC